MSNLQPIDWQQFLASRTIDNGGYSNTGNTIDKGGLAWKPKTPSKGAKNNGSSNTGRSGGRNSSGNGSASGRYGAVGAYPGIPRKRAARIVNGQIRELMRGLRHEKRQTKRESREGVRDIEDLYGRTMSGLDNINNIASQYMAQQQGLMNQGFTNAQGQVAAADAAAQQQMTQVNDDLRNAATAELARLGMGNGQINTQAWDATNAAAMQSQAQVAANNQSNLGLEGSGANAIAGLLQGALAGNIASRKGTATTDRQAAVNEIGDDTRSVIADIMAEMRNTRKSRGDAINELLEQMVAGDFDRWATTKDMSFQQWLAKQNLGMDRNRLRLGLLQDAAAAQTGATGWDNVYNSPWGNGPGNGGNPKRRNNNGGATNTRKYGDRDTRKGPAW